MKPKDGYQFLIDLHEDAPEWMEHDLELAGKSWAKIDLSKFEKIAMYVIQRTPLRFAECFLTNAEEDGGTRWRFYDYQKPMAEYLHNLVQVGAYGTGKTRDIEAKIWWSLVVEKSTVLLATLQQTSRDTVFSEMEYHRTKSKYLSQLFPDGNSKQSFKRGNVFKIIGPWGNECRLILVGREGYMAHSIHVGRIFGDECDQWPERAWPAVMSRAKEGAPIQLHSVPNGPPGSMFSKMEMDARPFPLERMRVDPRVGPTYDNQVRFAFAHFERPQMPSWNDTEKGRAITLYGKGSEAHPDYQSWVLGRRTDPINKVWRSADLDMIFVRVPGYRILQVSWNEPDKSVMVSACIGIDISDGRSMRRLKEEKHDINQFDLITCVNKFIPSMPCHSCGYDYGEEKDPAEIGLFEQIPGGSRCRSRIELLYVPFDEQVNLIKAIERGKMNFRPRYGWGFEGTGSPTKNIYKTLVGKNGGVNSDRITMYNWTKNRPLMAIRDDDGNLIFQDNVEKIKVTMKEYTTDLIDSGIRYRRDKGSGGIELHIGDTVLRKEFDEHTSKMGTSGKKIYKEDDDHCVEMVRCGNARLVDKEMSNEGVRAKTARGRAGGRGELERQIR